MSVAVSTGPRRIELSGRVLTVLGGGIAALGASTGIPADRLFDQPNTVKYALTVLIPLYVAVLATVRRPLWVATAVAVFAAPVDFAVTFKNVEVTPLMGALLIAVAIAAWTKPEEQIGRRGVTVGAALLLLLPGVVAGSDRADVILWLTMTGLAGWVVFTIAQQGPDGMRFVLRCLLSAASLQAVIAVWEYKTGQVLSYAGGGVSRQSADYFFNFGGDLRPPGTLPDPIGLGNVLALAIPLTIPMLLRETRPAARIAVGAAGGVCVLALLLTLSRMSWIGAAVGTAVAVALLPGEKRLPGLALASAIMVVMVAIALSLGGSALRERASTVFKPTDTSNASTRTIAEGDQYRTRLWQAAVREGAQEPVTGTGFGRLGDRLARAGVPVKAGGHAHDTYLQFFASAGIPGLAGLLLLVGIAIGGILRLRRRAGIEAAGLAGSVVAILVVWTTDVEITYVQVSAMMALILALAVARTQAAPMRIP